MVHPLRLLSAAQVHSLPPTEFLSSTRLVARGFNVIFGPSGVYKSFYALGLALELAQIKSVVYVAGEGVGGLSRRLKSWCEFYGLTEGNLNFICSEVNLLSAETINAFGKSVYKLKPELVVFDTWARCIPGGDESSAKDSGTAIRHVSIMQRELETASLIIHHSNRAERGERGSGALRGAADTMLEMSIAGDGSINVECSKSKDEEPWATESYRFQKVGNSGVLVPTAEYISEEITLQQLRILEFLAQSVFTQAGARAQQIMDGLSISRTRIYDVLSVLKDKQLINQDHKGDPYSLTGDGIKVLERRSRRQNLHLIQPDFEVEI